MNTKFAEKHGNRKNHCIKSSKINQPIPNNNGKKSRQIETKKYIVLYFPILCEDLLYLLLKFLFGTETLIQNIYFSAFFFCLFIKINLFDILNT